MAFARKVGDAWIEITGPFTIGSGDAARQYPASWARLATEDERAEAGVFEIEEAGAQPDDVNVLGLTLGGDDRPVRIWSTVAFDLSDLRAETIARVNGEAGAFRRRFITDIAGQQATYLAKEQEAKGWTAEADPADFPYLVNEAADTGSDIADVVALVLATAASWRALDPKIEGRRRGAAVAIGAAATVEAIQAAAIVDWDGLLA